MMTIALCLMLVWSLMIAPLTALAGEPDEDLIQSFGGEDFVSIATGREQPISKAPAVASVITAEDIEAMGATDLNEVLETVPGLHVSLSSTRFSPIYSIRGIHTDNNPQVLLLVNDVPITQLDLGDRGPRNVLPIHSIQRVEVIRGPGSAVYGADAFAGVINVITKTADDIDGTETGVRIGSFDSQEAWLQHGGHWGPLDVAFSFEASTTDGDDDRIIESDAQTTFDQAFGTNASLAPGPVQTGQDRYDIRLELGFDHWKLRAWNWRQYNGEPGPGLAQALDTTGEGKVNNYLVDLVFNDPEFSQYWEVNTRVSYYRVNNDSDQRLFPPGAQLPIGTDGNVNPVNPNGVVSFPDGLIGNPGFSENHYRFDFNTFNTRFRDHRLRLATGVNYAKLDPNETKNFGPGVIDGTESSVDGTLTDVSDTDLVFIESEDRTVYYASVQDEWEFAPDWSLTAGVRYDHYSDFGSTVNPRLALVWNTRQNLTTKLLYGRAFRAPSFAEQFNQNNPVVLGNDDLDPETINTLELAFDYHPRFDLSTGLNLFAYKIDDLIQFVPEASGIARRAQNTGEQDGYGLELEAAWDVFDQWELSGNYALQESKDGDNNDVPNAPSHQIYLQSQWRFVPNWRFTTEFNWIGGRERAPGDPRNDIDNYGMVDLFLRKKARSGNWDIGLGVRNALNVDAQAPSPFDPNAPQGAFIPGDYPLPERSIFVEARYRF